MKNKDTVFDYLGQIFIVYGIVIVSLALFSIVFGEEAKEVGSMFSLGAEGLSTATLLQFFLSSVLIATIRFIFFTDRFIKNMSLTLRTVCMFGLIIIVCAICILAFGWFPITEIFPWIMFFVCFVVFAGIGTFMTAWKERIENKKMEEALKKLK